MRLLRRCSNGRRWAPEELERLRKELATTAPPAPAAEKAAAPVKRVTLEGAVLDKVGAKGV